MAHVLVDNISKRYGEKVAVRETTFEVESGTLVSLLGPSGCGKTTMLNMIAGFVTPDQGRIFIAGEDVTKKPPYARDSSMVFQSYALFPHMRVFDNVAFGLRARKVPKAEIEQRVMETLAMLGLENLSQRYPRQLSGGQQQRVAIARSLVVRPAVLLMDEPLSNLDAKLRQEIRVELRKLQKNLKQTIIFVTHDQEEAFSISDRVIVMRDGQVEQSGPPQELFERPRTRFVADFVGVANIFDGQPDGSGFRTTDGLYLPLGSLRVRPGDSLGIRPLALELLPDEGAASKAESTSRSASPSNGGTPSNADYIALPGTVANRIYLGNSIRYYVQVDGLGKPLVVDSPAVREHSPRQEGDRVTVGLDIKNLLVLQNR